MATGVAGRAVLHAGRAAALALALAEAATRLSDRSDLRTPPR
jgi:hypothetical protein